MWYTHSMALPWPIHGPGKSLASNDGSLRIIEIFFILHAHRWTPGQTGKRSEANTWISSVPGSQWLSLFFRNRWRQDLCFILIIMC